MAYRRRAQFKRHTVPALAMEILINALEAIGGDASEALARAGLLDVRHPIGTNGEGEVPRSSFAKLSKECLLAFHRHSCRRDGLRPFPVSSFRLMCVAMLACPNLRTAIETAGAFQDAILGGTDRLKLTRHGCSARLEINPCLRGKELSDLLIVMYSLAAFARLLGWLIGEDIELSDIMLAFPKATEQWAFNELFQLEPNLGGHHNAIEFPGFYLDQPVIRKYSELPTLLTLFPFDMYSPDENVHSLADRIRVAMRAAILRGEHLPKMIELAKMFGLTLSTFRRRIAAENTSLSEIGRECRQQLAAQLLLDGTLTIKEIAARLQFSDISSFRRAFRSWNGQSPLSYRANIGSSARELTNPSYSP